MSHCSAKLICERSRKLRCPYNACTLDAIRISSINARSQAEKKCTVVCGWVVMIFDAISNFSMSNHAHSQISMLAMFFLDKFPCSKIGMPVFEQGDLWLSRKNIPTVLLQQEQGKLATGNLVRKTFSYVTAFNTLTASVISLFWFRSFCITLLRWVSWKREHRYLTRSTNNNTLVKD